MPKAKKASNNSELDKVIAMLTELKKHPNFTDLGVLYNIFKKVAEENKHILVYENNKGETVNFFEGLPASKDHLRDVSVGRSATTFTPTQLHCYQICLEKVPEFLESQFSIIKEKSSKPLEKITEEFKRDFYVLLQNQIKRSLKGAKPFEFIQKFSESIRVTKDELLEFIVGNPTLLFSFIDKDYLTVKERNLDIPLVSKIYHFNTEIETDLFKEATEDFDDFFNGGKNLEKPFNAKLSKANKNPGLFLGHALSPHSDSICLLYELGRFKRIADIYGVPHKVYLTDPNWAKYNRSASEVHENENKRVAVLKQCFDFRKRLYEKLRIDIDKIQEGDIKSENGKITAPKIKESASEFAQYSEHIKKIEVDPKKDKIPQWLKILENLCSPDNSDSYVDKLPPELKILALTIVGDTKNLFAIHTTLRHFRSLDENTFYYTLLQRYVQHQYKGWVKLAVESERKFDASFIKLDKVDDHKESNWGAVYYKHYYFTKGKDSYPLNVIPYTFPSGRVWKRADGDLQKAIDNTILLWDFEGDRQEKIRKIIGQIDLKQLAIQMADLFSFSNYFFDEEFWTGRTDSKGEYRLGLNDLLNELDSGSAKAWQQYRENPEMLKTFCQYFLTMWYAEMELPYYFYPFMHVHKAEKEKEFEAKLRKTYANIIIYTLTELNKSLPTEEWK